MKDTPKLSESSIQHSVLDYLNKCQNWFVWRQASHAVFDPSIRAYRKPGVFEIPGRSDIIGTFWGRIVAIEVKKPKEKLKPEQEAFLTRIHKMDGIACCVWSLDHAVQLRKEVESGEYRLVIKEEQWGCPDAEKHRLARAEKDAYRGE